MRGRKWLLKVGSIPYKGLYNFLNFWVPKENRAVVISNAKAEDNAIEMANFLAVHFEGKVDLLLPEDEIEGMRQFLHPEVRIFASPRYMPLKWADFKRINRARYIFLTHQFLYARAPRKQKYINLWHGLAYKKIQSLRPYDGIPAQADYTISGSAMTQRLNAKIFDVPEKSVWITGLPRNDVMLRSMRQKDDLMSKIDINFDEYTKVMIWMPTYRRTDEKASIEIQSDRFDPFGIGDFDLHAFNEILRKNKVLCLMKTHHILKPKNEVESYSNLYNINDAWLAEQGVLLYQLLACTDALISDYSSVMIDYMLLDRPIFCLATDLENYKKTQGLIFEDYERWVPSKLYTDQDDFFMALRRFLKEGEDSFREKRRKLVPEFFEYTDDRSAQRILDCTLELK